MSTNLSKQCDLKKRNVDQKVGKLSLINNSKTPPIWGRRSFR